MRDQLGKFGGAAGAGWDWMRDPRGAASERCSRLPRPSALGVDPVHRRQRQRLHLAWCEVAWSESQGPVAASPDDLAAAADKAGHSVYWAGPQDGTTLELTITKDGGATSPDTASRLYRCRRSAAEAALRRSAPTRSSTPTTPSRSIRSPARSSRAHQRRGARRQRPKLAEQRLIGYRHQDVQVEVYDPNPQRALSSPTSGDVTAGGLSSSGAAARRAGARCHGDAARRLAAVPARARGARARRAGCWSSGRRACGCRAAALAAGFAAIVVVGQFLTRSTRPPSWRRRSVVALAVGRARARRCRGRLRVAEWALGRRGGRRVRRLRGADRALRAGRPSPATSSSTTPPPGWRSPTGSWSTGAASPASRRRPTRRRSPSTSAPATRSASSCRSASARELVGQDVAWLIQPYMAFVARAAGARRSGQLAGPLVRRRACARWPRSSPRSRRCCSATTSGAGSRRSPRAALIATAARCSPALAIRGASRAAALVPLAVGGCGAARRAQRRRRVWLAPSWLAALVLSPCGRSARARPRCGAPRVRRLAVAVAVRPGARARRAAAADLVVAHRARRRSATCSARSTRSSCRRSGRRATSGSIPSRLGATLRADRGRRGSPRLIGARPGGARASLGAARSTSAAALAACAVIVAIGSPWVGGKALAIASPAILVRGRCRGARRCWPAGRRRRGGDRCWRSLAAASSGRTRSPTATSTSRPATSSPSSRRSATDRRRGPDADDRVPALRRPALPARRRPEGASELRRRQVPLRGGGTLPKGSYRRHRPVPARRRCSAYRTLVLRRSPGPEPPAVALPADLARRLLRGLAATRGAGVVGRSTISGSAPRGTRRERPSARPWSGSRTRRAPAARSCGQARTGRGRPAAAHLAPERLALGRVPPDASSGERRDDPVASTGAALRPLRGLARWLGAPGGRPVGRWTRGGPGPAPTQQRGRVRPAGGGPPGRGRSRARDPVRWIADLHPGSGGAPSPIGPLAPSRQDMADTRVVHFPPGEATQLCGKPWDWIEALG